MSEFKGTIKPYQDSWIITGEDGIRLGQIVKMWQKKFKILGEDTYGKTVEELALRLQNRREAVRPWLTEEMART